VSASAERTPASAPPTTVPGRVVRVISPRALIWLFHLSLPLLGLWLLLAHPALDPLLEQHTVHFWLILNVALINVGLAIVIGRAAAERDDARLYLVALAFASAAGFFALHALATPQVLLQTPNAAFTLSTPVGIVIAGIFGVASTVEPSRHGPTRVLRSRALLAGIVIVAMVAWAVASVVPGSPLHRPLPEAQAGPILRALAVVGVTLCVVVAVSYLAVYRRRPSVVLIGIITAYALLAEALIAVALSHSWHASWWEWHVLLLLGFGYVAYSAQVQYRREGRSTTLFRALSLEETVRRLEDEYATALERLVGAIEDSSEDGSRDDVRKAAADLSGRFGLTEGQVDVLARAAESLAAERREVRRLGLFRRYLSPEVATALLADPSQAGLGGETVEVSVLFADLRGFTPFAERSEPEAVVELLNEYFGVVVPIILAEGGTVVQFVGDAIMAIFNAPVRQPDHALRAARAALAFQRGIAALADGRPDRPRFRAGIATGPAVVGNVGSEEVRSFTAIGETVNLAARLQAAAEVGTVVVSAATAAQLDGRCVLHRLADLQLKGIAEPVAAFELEEVTLPSRDGVAAGADGPGAGVQ